MSAAVLTPDAPPPAPLPLAVLVTEPANGAQHYMREDWYLDGIVNGDQRTAVCGTTFIAQDATSTSSTCVFCTLVARGQKAGLL